MLKLSLFLIVLINATSGASSNYSLSGNQIWDDLLKSCRNASSGYLCVQNNLFRYVDNVLLNTEFYVSDSFYFKSKVNNSQYNYNQVPPNQTPTPLFNVHAAEDEMSYNNIRAADDDESLQFNNFIDELESVEQKIDAEDIKHQHIRTKRRKNTERPHNSQSDNVDQSRYNHDESSILDNADVNADDTSNKDSTTEKQITYDWKSVEQSKVSEDNVWNINLKQVVNRKPEWDLNKETSQAFGNGVDESKVLENETVENSWVPSKPISDKKKHSSRIKQARSVNLQQEDVKKDIQNQVKESSTEKAKVPEQTAESLPPTEDTSFPSKDEIEQNMIPDSEHMPEAPYKTIYDVSAMFYEKSVNYFMNHDLIFFLPQFMFGGAQITLSPKGIETDGGINLKLNINPLARSNQNGQSRLFFKHMHKIRQSAFKKNLIAGHRFSHSAMDTIVSIVMGLCKCGGTQVT
ncbi:hypothetical protein WDU94_002443 [Cyamophila willieti]